MDLPYPLKIDDKVTLLIFGFDENQKSGRLKELFIEDKTLSGLQYYVKGKIQTLKMLSLWNEAKVI